MINKIISVLGKPLQSKEVKSFLAKHGFKYPKKDSISNRSVETEFWIENKKAGVSLLFSVQPYNPDYRPVADSRKGMYVPIFIQADFNEKGEFEFPFDLNFKLSFDQLKKKLGKPTLKSSEISPVWLNEDGTESFYRWSKVVKGDVLFNVEYNCEKASIRYMSLGIKYNIIIFELYDELKQENVETLSKAKNDFTKTSKLMFLKWAIQNGLLKVSKTNKKLIAEIKSGKKDSIDFIKSLDRGYVLESDFSKSSNFIRMYIHNLTDYDILFQSDLANTFLVSKKLRDNYLGEEAQKVLNQVEDNVKNYKRVENVINKRFKEFEKHKFEKSKSIS
jgi:hypothetical protein